jgi:hypothetical protein
MPGKGEGEFAGGEAQGVQVREALSIPAIEHRRGASSDGVLVERNDAEMLSTTRFMTAPVDISNPAIREQAKTGHRASAQAEGVVSRSLLEEQGA